MTLANNYASTDEVDHAYDIALDTGAKAAKTYQKVFLDAYSGHYVDPERHI